MKVLIGLGNPGAEYALTRHNVGFLCLDALRDNLAFPPFKAKFQGSLTEGDFERHKLFLFKPLTFMNRSGEPTQKLLKFYQIPLHDVFVFHDDIDLEPGKVRIKKGGGTGGHNGLKSLDQMVGPDYWRVRIGVGRPTHSRLQATDHVLGRFSDQDEDWLVPLLQDLSADLGLLFGADPTLLTQQINQLKG